MTSTTTETSCTCGANCNIGRRVELGLPAFCRIERAPVGAGSVLEALVKAGESRVFAAGRGKSYLG